jgi:hypothetical protein
VRRHSGHPEIVLDRDRDPIEGTKSLALQAPIIGLICCSRGTFLVDIDEGAEFFICAPDASHAVGDKIG